MRGVVLVASVAAAATFGVAAPRADGGDAAAPKVLGGGDVGVKRVDAELQARIDAAIGRGRRFLEATEDDGRRPAAGLRQAYAYELGHAALCALALLNAGSDPEGPALTRALHRVRTGVAARLDARGSASRVDTYTAGLTVALLLEAGAPADDALVVHLVRLLEASYGGEGMWGYPTSEDPAAYRAFVRGGGVALDGNVSTTQYALLGLHAAHVHGVALPDDAYGPEHALLAAAQTQRAGGWGYSLRAQGALGDPYLGATASTLASYVMAGEITGRWATPQAATSDPVVRDALRWLDAHWKRQGFARGTDIELTRDPTYNLYAIERIGVLLDRDVLVAHPWYADGARFLVAAQRADGAWDVGPRRAGAGLDEFSRTAFALLFLARHGRPVGMPEPETTPRDSQSNATGDGEAPPRAADALRGVAWWRVYHRALSRAGAMPEGAARDAELDLLVRLGVRIVPALVADLEDARAERRAVAHAALLRLTDETLAFDAGAADGVRARQVAAWRTWLALVSGRLVVQDGRIAPSAATGAGAR